MAHPNQRDAASLPVELRRTTVPAAVRDWIARSAGSPAVRWRRLAGASSTAVHGVWLADGRRVVLRRYSWPGFLEDEPVAPSREVDALRHARRHGLPAPEVVAADATGDDVGDGVPVVLMSYVAGGPVGVPDLRLLAELAASVHEVDAGGLDHEYFPWYRDSTAGPPRDATRPALWEAAIDVWHGAMPACRPSLVHRDFHPGNVLWSRRRVAGIVDWANACRGPAGCDVAHCRANLIGLAGDAVADAFADAYEAVTGRPHHPYWEVASVLEHGPSHWAAPTVAAAERRLGRALAELGVC